MSEKAGWINLFTDISFDVSEADESRIKVVEALVVKYRTLAAGNNDFSNLNIPEDFLREAAERFPEKLEKLNIKLRPCGERSFSHIITDEEVDMLASSEYYNWIERQSETGDRNGTGAMDEGKLSFLDIARHEQRFFRELVYAIPVSLLECGLELFRPTQFRINTDHIEDIAAAIHERYRRMLQLMNERSASDSIYELLGILNSNNRQYAGLDFNQLPDDIRASNIDSAYHIATKLLSAGYLIKQLREGEKQTLLRLSDREIETMARTEHERWAWGKRMSGFTYGVTRDDTIRKHPCLLPYGELPELEKEKDRVLVRMIPSLLVDIGFKAEPLSPEQLQNIACFQADRVLLDESILKIEKAIANLAETGKSPEIASQLISSLEIIKETRKGEAFGAVIQNSTLPSKILVRTMLPDSFILFKPRDILSGDFYFVTKVNDAIIFAAADCTGHGTSGALLSMICSSFLDQAVNDHKLINPSEIIHFVYGRIVAFMTRNNNTAVSNFGMEIALCTMFPDTNRLLFSGVNRDLNLFRNGSLEILKPQKVKQDGYAAMSIKPGTFHELQLRKGDTLYMYSDGYADQFGGPENKKFLPVNLRRLLEEIQPLDMLEQYYVLNNKIEEWKCAGPGGPLPQNDDILVFGVRI